MSLGKLCGSQNKARGHEYGKKIFKSEGMAEKGRRDIRMGRG